MMRYSIKPRNQIFVKGYGFSSSDKTVSKNTVKTITKNLSSKYNQTLLHHAKQSVTDAIKNTSKKSNSKNSRSNWLFDWK